MDYLSHGSEKGVVSVARHHTYPLLMGMGTLESLPRVMRNAAESDSVFVVTDDNVAPLYLKRCVDMLRNSDFQVKSIVLPAGESSKSWETAQRVLAALASEGSKRRSILVALGGGVICDLVGFVASIYMRGVPYVNVPTSLMAQLDAAIGGKTGIDFNGSKNLVGCFYHPCAVVVDPNFLATLPSRDIRSGIAEAVKVGILFPGLFDLLELLGKKSEVAPSELAAVVQEAVTGKLKLLESDPFELSLVRLLNLGHTVGHALEAATKFVQYRHGEAVSVGIAVASEVSRQRGLCTSATCRRIVTLLEDWGLPVHLPAEHARSTWEELQVIRRIRNGVLNEVLPLEVGLCEVVTEVELSEYLEAAQTLESRTDTCGDGQR
jgi:3-dehydroquinate synthase